MLAVPRSDACDTLDALADEPQLCERIVFSARTAGQRRTLRGAEHRLVTANCARA